MTTKHTPGPWDAVPHIIGESQRWFVQFGLQKATICSLNSCCLLYCNAEHDARLIAAAPDLLEALKAYRAKFGHCGDVAERADDAIKKATSPTRSAL